MDNFPFRGGRSTRVPQRNTTNEEDIELFDDDNTQAAPSRPASTNRRREASRPASGLGQRGIITLLLGLLVVAALAFGAWWLFQRMSVPSYVDPGKYQAVFLQNGEFYFGKVKGIDDKNIVLTNVFYVQKANAAEATKENEANLQLIKLGNEVHGPDDQMVINRDQVLYVENLKPEAKVVDSINKYYQQNKN